MLVTAINQTWSDKDTFFVTLQKNIEAVLESEKGQPLIDVDKRLAELQEELLKQTGARADYEDVAEKIYRLREDSFSWKAPGETSRKSASPTWALSCENSLPP
ncbi:hypothetical protein [Sporolactobacillus pectinivorans]|uniref:hypothetical protein n=1 Tax=Sporolactobacillus pectinivorans TaxID=1591408 RepID=UPI001EFD7E8E|nr:hypothetical protein [Sporolactobacillus pectinivorans]